MVFSFNHFVLVFTFFLPLVIKIHSFDLIWKNFFFRKKLLIKSFFIANENDDHFFALFLWLLSNFNITHSFILAWKKMTKLIDYWWELFWLAECLSRWSSSSLNEMKMKGKIPNLIPYWDKNQFFLPHTFTTLNDINWLFFMMIMFSLCVCVCQLCFVDEFFFQQRVSS